ncbi:AAA family ATPase [Streptomyces triculaminicus]|uniref:AAA family ATPase n=2 Tax=Streptomyces TaxID=1883 RepID=A0A939FTD5_9ACTN|nr:MULTISPECIES: LuxR family transcriptional regulator [Streptomyces]MBO0656358.1 AAA family ATPase [Streptomyces triculaminicus]QSY50346.1 AAA family ATPase [Streptomyces griseocarneus]
MEREYSDALEGLVGQFEACAEGGGGQLALVTGGLASGKTHLAHAFARHTTRNGALHLMATGSRAERDFPGGVLDQLFRNSRVPAETAARVTRLLSELADPGTGSGTASDAGPGIAPPHAEARVLHTLCVELLELARQRPLVVSVDDIQFADAFSLRLVLHLRQRMAAAPVMIVLTEWSWGLPTLSRFHADLARQPYQLVELTALPVAAVAAGLAERTTPQQAQDHAAHVHRLAGGNPLLVHALTEDLRNGRPVPSATCAEAGPAFTQAVLNCLYRWDGDLLSVAQGIAVLDEHASAPLVAELMSLPADRVGRTLNALAAAGLVDGARLRHPVARTVALSPLPATERAHLHRTAAELLQHRGADPVTVAEHLITAGSADPWATGVLRAAAARATAYDNVELATRCLELAMDSCSDPAGAAALRHTLARTLWRVEPAAAARHHAAARTALDHDGLAVRDALPLLKQALWQGDLDTARGALRTYTQQAADDERDSYAEAELRLAQRWFYGATFTRGPGAPDCREKWCARGPHTEDPWTRAVDAVCDGISGSTAKNAVASAEHILKSCRLGETFLEVVLAALLTLIRGNGLERAAEWSDKLYAEAVRRGGLTWQAALGAVRADIALRRGEPGTAAVHARTALDLLAPQSWGALRGYPLGTLVAAHTALDDPDAAEEAVRQMPSDSLSPTVWSLTFLYARGRHHLSVGRVLAAAKDFRNCGGLAQEWDLDSPELVPWRNGLAEVNLRLGRTVIARDLAKQQLDRYRGTSLRTQGVSLRLLAATAEPPQQPGLLRKSVSLLEASGDRMELARSLADLSVVLRSIGELDEARAASWRAAQETKLCRSAIVRPEAPALPEQNPLAHTHSGIPASDTPGPGSSETTEISLLSDAEGRVALLAARGFSNRDISQQLFITVSTVEQHLTRVYRKLGVSGRRGLLTLLPNPQRQSV